MRKYVFRAFASVFLASIAIVGCSNSVKVSESEQVPTQEVDYSESSAEWKPSSPIITETYSEEERLQLREKDLQNQLKGMNLPDPPKIDLVQWSRSLTQWSDSMAVCMKEAGYPTVPDGYGAVRFKDGVPVEQIDAAHLALYTCNARFTMLPEIKDGWSADQAGLVYDYWTEAYLPCIEAHGYPYPGEIPSREVFIEERAAGRSDTFDPMSFVQRSSYDDTSGDLVKACPPLPKSEYLYGI